MQILLIILTGYDLNYILIQNNLHRIKWSWIISGNNIVSSN